MLSRIRTLAWTTLLLILSCAIASIMAIVPSVEAASFSCLSASTAGEKFICSVFELSSLDEILDVSYKKAREGLSEAAQKVLTSGQRSWIKYWERACSTNGKGTQFDQEESPHCARQEYERRIKRLLKSTHILNGKYRIYPVDNYAAVQTLNHDTGAINTRNTLYVLGYPQLDTQNLSKSELAFANKLNALLFSKIARFEKTHKDEENDVTDISSYTTLVSLSPNILGVCEGYYYYPHGAPHGEGGNITLFFNKEKTRPLQIEDFFEGKAWIQVLSEYSFENLRKQLGESFILKSAKELSDNVSHISAWWFTSQGLRIQFAVYTVGSYVDGMPAVVVPWKTLEPHLTNFAKAEKNAFKALEFPDAFGM